MSMPVFSDEAPEVEVRGDHFIYTYKFEGEKHHLVLSRFAAIRTVQLTMQSMDDAPSEAEVVTLQSQSKRGAAS